MDIIYKEHSQRLQLSWACQQLELCCFYYLAANFPTILPTWIKVQPVLGKKWCTRLRRKVNVLTTREEWSSYQSFISEPVDSGLSVKLSLWIKQAYLLGFLWLISINPMFLGCGTLEGKKKRLLQACWEQRTAKEVAREPNST